MPHPEYALGLGLSLRSDVLSCPNLSLFALDFDESKVANGECVISRSIPRSTMYN